MPPNNSSQPQSVPPAVIPPQQTDKKSLRRNIGAALVFKYIFITGVASNLVWVLSLFGLLPSGFTAVALIPLLFVDIQFAYLLPIFAILTIKQRKQATLPVSDAVLICAWITIIIIAPVVLFAIGAFFYSWNSFTF